MIPIGSLRYKVEYFSGLDKRTVKKWSNWLTSAWIACLRHWGKFMSNDAMIKCPKPLFTSSFDKEYLSLHVCKFHRTNNLWWCADKDWVVTAAHQLWQYHCCSLNIVTKLIAGPTHEWSLAGDTGTMCLCSIILGWAWDTLFDCVQWCPHHPVQCSVPGATDNSVECGEGKKWLPFDYLNTEHCSYGELKSQQSVGYINTHTVTFVNNRQLFRYIFANRFVSIITLCNIGFKLSMNRLC